MRPASPLFGNIPRLLTTIATLVLLSSLTLSAQEAADKPNLETGSFGVTVGTPGGFNLNMTMLGQAKWGFTFSGGYLGNGEGEHFAGVQLGAVRALGRSKHHYAGAHFFGGYLNIQDCDDDISAAFVGTGALIKWQVLYGEISLMAGSWTDEWPAIQVGAQIGFAIVTFH